MCILLEKQITWCLYLSSFFFFSFFLQPGIEAGDVIIVLQQKEHEVFTRKDTDLVMEYNISLTEALCGFQFVIKHLDGRDLVINSQPGEVICPGISSVLFSTWLERFKSYRELLNFTCPSVLPCSLRLLTHPTLFGLP